jgi:hypothetical protein
MLSDSPAKTEIGANKKIATQSAEMMRQGER